MSSRSACATEQDLALKNKQKNQHFKVNNSVIFRTFTGLYNYISISYKTFLLLQMKAQHPLAVTAWPSLSHSNR
jgi:hypothetical protein